MIADLSAALTNRSACHCRKSTRQATVQLYHKCAEMSTQLAYGLRSTQAGLSLTIVSINEPAHVVIQDGEPTIWSAWGTRGGAWQAFGSLMEKVCAHVSAGTLAGLPCEGKLVDPSAQIRRDIRSTTANGINPAVLRPYTGITSYT